MFISNLGHAPLDMLANGSYLKERDTDITPSNPVIINGKLYNRSTTQVEIMPAHTEDRDIVEDVVIPAELDDDGNVLIPERIEQQVTGTETIEHPAVYEDQHTDTLVEYNGQLIVDGDKYYSRSIEIESVDPFADDQTWTDGANTVSSIEEAKALNAILERAAKFQPLSRQKLRKALLIEFGITAAMVNALIDAMPAGAEKEMSLIEWQDAPVYLRDHPLIAQFALLFELKESEIDAAWIKYQA